MSVVPKDPASGRESVSGPSRGQFTPKDVTLCLVNARRLMRDSRRVSPESRLVLLELAMEELAKGYMVLFRMLASGQLRLNERIRLPQVDGTEKAVEMVKAHREMFSDSALHRAFKYHEMKVGFVESLSDILLEVPWIPVDDRNVDTRGLPFWTVVRLARGRIREYSRIGDASNRRLIAKIRSLADEPLYALAKRSTYVDLAFDGNGCIPPHANEELSVTLERFDRVWARTLELAVRLLTRI